MKIFCILLLLISVVNSFDRRFEQRASILRQLQDLLDDDDQEFDLTRRNNQYESDELDSDRRVFDDDDDDDDDEQYMKLRATAGSNGTNTGIAIILQNRAAMNTRLRVIYNDANGTPGVAESGRLWGGQTKSVKLPIGATNIYIIVEKDLFFENWRIAYNSTLTNENHCLRITGATFKSKVHSCKQKN